MKKKEVLEAINTGRLYDYICNHGHEATKDELIILAKECYFAGTCSATRLTHQEYTDELYENVSDYMYDDDEE